MDRETDWIRPVVILFLLAAPAVGLRVASHFADDPDLRPLAITSGRPVAYSQGRAEAGPAMIEVSVNWGEDWAGAMKRAALRDMIARSLASRTDLYLIRFQDVPGARVKLYFRVGPNVFGPYPPEGMRDGLHSALVALSATIVPLR
ncbi:hypothetical protein [Aquicoccus sp.]|uniref:hypothetical protein n=1 Tax=Aquicoccus sp. TaxID=2055851 RepID=UPI0035612D0B